MVIVLSCRHRAGPQYEQQIPSTFRYEKQNVKLCTTQTNKMRYFINKYLISDVFYMFRCEQPSVLLTMMRVKLTIP